MMALLAALAVSACPAELRVLTLNVQNDAVGRVPGIVDVIKRSGADVAGLQESSASGPEIAERLGWGYARPEGGGPVISRHELAASAAAGAVDVRVPGAGDVTVSSLHLPHAPYQPYQLLGIRYEDSRFIESEAEAVSQALAARGGDVARAIKQLADAAKTGGLGTVVVGDFNEPSFLDWTRRAADAGRHPLKVEWPSTKAFADAGYRDAYRELHPDELAKPGYTWKPGLDPRDPKDHADRIDFVLYKGLLRPVSAKIVGESAATSDVVVTPYPTDHRGKLVRFLIKRR